MGRIEVSSCGLSDRCNSEGLIQLKCSFQCENLNEPLHCCDAHTMKKIFMPQHLYLYQ
jgi:hypothetical protein